MYIPLKYLNIPLERRPLESEGRYVCMHILYCTRILAREESSGCCLLLLRAIIPIRLPSARKRIVFRPASCSVGIRTSRVKITVAPSLSFNTITSLAFPAQGLSSKITRGIARGITDFSIHSVRKLDPAKLSYAQGYPGKRFAPTEIFHGAEVVSNVPAAVRLLFLNQMAWHVEP